MSFADVRPFFRGRLETLGLIEHPDSVDFNNIASTVLDQSYQLETSTITGTPAVQLAHSFDYSVTVRVFLRGYERENSEAFDRADQLVEEVYGAVLPSSVRLGQTIKDIVPTAVRKTALSVSDDNDILIELDFNLTLLRCYT